MKNCQNCKYFNRLADNSKSGLCLNVDVMLADDDKGLEIHDSNLTAGMIVVGQNFGCIHFVKNKKS